MRTSAIISSLLHVGILFWAFAGFSATREFKAKPVQSIPVEILSPGEFTKLKAGDKKEKAEKTEVKKPKPPVKQVKKEKPKKKKAVKKAVAAPPKQEKKEAIAVPKKKTAKKPKPKPKPKIAEKKVKKKVKPRPQKKKASKKSNFDADKIAALLNKIPDAGGSNAQKAPVAQKRQVSRGDTRGRDKTISVSEIDAFRAQISQCWNPPIGGLGAERIVVKVRISLNKDGTINRSPKVVNSMSSVSFLPAADSATRAIWQCQPYTMFTPERYNVWREMVLSFDPRQMYGG
ncbi:MAG: hypothetical protein ACR2OW_02630 [Methyloligellaceae bacterium]